MNSFSSTRSPRDNSTQNACAQRDRLWALNKPNNINNINTMLDNSDRQLQTSSNTSSNNNNNQSSKCCR
jgi:hypothetical protein